MNSRSGKSFKYTSRKVTGISNKKKKTKGDAVRIVPKIQKQGKASIFNNNKWIKSILMVKRLLKLLQVQTNLFLEYIE